MKQRGADVYIPYEDLFNDVPFEDIIEFYGKKEIFYCLSTSDIIKYGDIDELLEEIGDERIAEYFNEHIKTKDIA